MKPDKTSVYDLFYNQRRFAVPLYQRPYVWSLEAQWQPLWQDSEDKAQAVLQRQTDVPHFLGAIVTGQRPVFGNRISSWDIIDGQQRLTTLQVVLKAFKDVMNARAGKESRYDFDLKRIEIESLPPNTQQPACESGRCFARVQLFPADPETPPHR